MREKFENLKNNPEFQEKLKEMKPKKTIWGFLAIVLFFFLPELLNVLYYQEINAWFWEFFNANYPPALADKMVWLMGKVFDGELSFLNIGLGVGLLWWMYK